MHAFGKTHCRVCAVELQVYCMKLRSTVKQFAVQNIEDQLYLHILVTDLLHPVTVSFKWHFIQLLHVDFILLEYSVNC